MKLVAKVDYGNHLSENIDLIDGVIEDVDLFTNSFTDEKNLKEFLNAYLEKRKTDKKVVGINLIDGDMRYPLLYRDYAFIYDIKQKGRVISFLKYMSVDKIYPYYEHLMENDEKAESLYLELKNCELKPDTKYYKKFHELYNNDYLRMRNMALNLISNEDLRNFRYVEPSGKRYIISVLSKFYKSIHETIPKSEKKDLSSEQYNEQDFINSILNNDEMITDEKISELDMLLNDIEKIREYTEKERRL